MDDEKIIGKNQTESAEEKTESGLFDDLPLIEKPVAEAPSVIVKKTNRKKSMQKKYPDKIAFLLGMVIVIFAITGIVFTIVSGVNYFKGVKESENEFADYNRFLSPVAAVDIDTFDDITAADKEQLINAAMWLILSDETTPDTYPYSGGYMLIPEKDVESAYISLFGPETAQKFTHMTVQGYNSIFEYDETNAVYKIPVTTITPVYTPRVTAVEQSGTSLIVTTEYLAAESWMRDDEGNFVAPDPDKVMQITLRELQGSYYISAMQIISSTIPEIVTKDNVIDEEDSSPAQETTTKKETEKTTLGGRV